MSDDVPEISASRLCEVEALLCLSLDSRQGVDAIVEKAVLAGGKADPGPKQDHGFMYGRSFEETELGQPPSSRHLEPAGSMTSSTPRTPGPAGRYADD